MVQAHLFNVVIDPSGFMVQNGDHDLAAGRHSLLEGISEVVGSVAFDLNANGFLEGDSESLGALLEHSHEFLGIGKVVVHHDPVVETGGKLKFLLHIS